MLQKTSLLLERQKADVLCFVDQEEAPDKDVIRIYLKNIYFIHIEWLLNINVDKLF